MSAESLLRAHEAGQEPLPRPRLDDTGPSVPTGGCSAGETTERLRKLIDRGFRFTHPRNADGVLVAIVGIRPHHGVIDIVQLYSEHDADAARIPGDEPDVLFPRNVLWRTTGEALNVLDTMLGLKDPLPKDDKASCHAGGCWVPTQPGRATWLAASA